MMTVRDHAALPTPQAWQRLLSQLQQQLRTVDNAAVAMLLMLSLALMLALGTQVWRRVEALLVDITPLVTQQLCMSWPQRTTPAHVGQSVALSRATTAALDAFAGVWIKDGAASDSMEEAVRCCHSFFIRCTAYALQQMDAVALNGMLRLAVRLIKGMELTVTEDTFTMSMLTVFSWYKVHEQCATGHLDILCIQVTEHYTLDGSPSTHRRRDLRRGRHTGSVVVASGGKLLELRLQWDDPLGGVEVDRFSLEGSDRLVVETSMSMDSGRAVAYKTVYQRRRR